MLIGKDFDKIEFQAFGLDLLEPMAFITDSLLGILGFYLAWFFIIIGVSTTTGGLAHLFYHYFGIYGKIPSWIFAPISMYFLERATTSVFPNPKVVKTLKWVSIIKYFLVLAAWLAICFSLDLDDPANEKKPFLPLAVNSAIGAISCTAVLTTWYAKKLDKAFMWFTYGTLIVFPSIFFIIIRINPHRWFNGEDLGHILMMSTNIMSYIGIKKVNLHLA